MVRIICEHAERIQYVRNYKVRLAINRNTKPIYILPDEVVNDKKSQLQKYGEIARFVAQAHLVQHHHHEPPPSDHTALGRIAASTTCCVRATAILCSTWYNFCGCCCIT